jgi:hypothetical protein
LPSSPPSSSEDAGTALDVGSLLDEGVSALDAGAALDEGFSALDEDVVDEAGAALDSGALLDEDFAALLFSFVASCELDISPSSEEVASAELNAGWELSFAGAPVLELESSPQATSTMPKQKNRTLKLQNLGIYEPLSTYYKSLRARRQGMPAERSS